MIFFKLIIKSLRKPSLIFFLIFFVLDLKPHISKRYVMFNLNRIKKEVIKLNIFLLYTELFNLNSII